MFNDEKAKKNSHTWESNAGSEFMNIPNSTGNGDGLFKTNQ